MGGRGSSSNIAKEYNGSMYSKSVNDTVQEVADSLVMGVKSPYEGVGEYAVYGRTSGKDVYITVENQRTGEKNEYLYKKTSSAKDLVKKIEANKVSDKERAQRKEFANMEKQRQERIKYNNTKKMLLKTIAEIDNRIKLFDKNPTANGLKMAQQLEKQKKGWQTQLANLESQYSKLLK